jgi:hypothetical protein
VRRAIVCKRERDESSRGDKDLRWFANCSPAALFLLCAVLALPVGLYACHFFMCADFCSPRRERSNSSLLVVLVGRYVRGEQTLSLCGGSPSLLRGSAGTVVGVVSLLLQTRHLRLALGCNPQPDFCAETEVHVYRGVCSSYQSSGVVHFFGSVGFLVGLRTKRAAAPMFLISVRAREPCWALGGGDFFFVVIEPCNSKTFLRRRPGVPEVCIYGQLRGSNADIRFKHE